LTSDLRAASLAGRTSLDVTPHHCFACGSLNLHGLGLVLHIESGRSWTETTLGATFEGWEGIAHGGILATILDEVMAWSLAASDNWGVTASMRVRFRRPVPIDRTIRAEGWITEGRRRVSATAAVIRDVATGEELATAEGTYVAADETRKAQLRARYGLA
jgi:acyl-coenzyme A thioesterase PaaI-like protein